MSPQVVEIPHSDTPFSYASSKPVGKDFRDIKITFFEENNTQEEELFQKKYNDALEKISKFKELSNNWDSYNANRITQTTISRAEGFLRSIFLALLKKDKNLSEPFVAPCPDGSIQFEWNIGAREIEILIPYSEHIAVSYLMVENEHYNEGEVSTHNELIDFFT